MHSPQTKQLLKEKWNLGSKGCALNRSARTILFFER